MEAVLFFVFLFTHIIIGLAIMTLLKENFIKKDILSFYYENFGVNMLFAYFPILNIFMLISEVIEYNKDKK